VNFKKIGQVITTMIRFTKLIRIDKLKLATKCNITGKGLGFDWLFFRIYEESSIISLYLSFIKKYHPQRSKVVLLTLKELWETLRNESFTGSEIS